MTNRSPEESFVQVTRGHREDVDDVVLLLLGLLRLHPAREASGRRKEGRKEGVSGEGGG